MDKITKLLRKLGVEEECIQTGNMWLALFDADPSTGGKETTYGSYTRLPININRDFNRLDSLFYNSSSTIYKNNTTLNFPTSTKSDESKVNYVCLMSKEKAGNVLYKCQMSIPYPTPIGMTHSFPPYHCELIL